MQDSVQGGFECLTYDPRIKEAQEIINRIPDFSDFDGKMARLTATYSTAEKEKGKLSSHLQSMICLADREEGAPDLINLVERCGGEVELAVTIIEDYFIQGTECCLKIQESFSSKQLDQLHFHTVSGYNFTLFLIVSFWYPNHIIHRSWPVAKAFGFQRYTL